MIIAVDFDGTIVEHKYPAIGRELPLVDNNTFITKHEYATN